MNGKANTHRDGLLGFSWTVACVAFLVNPPASLAAEAGTSRHPESISATVSLADLDLATAAGKGAARVRIAAVARKLCRRFRDSSSLADRESFAECWKHAQDEALLQLDGHAGAGWQKAGAGDLAARRND
jgi:UrcA family protein